MADQKLSALTAITSADNSDLLYIVDVTGNTPQKITVANLLAAVGAQSKILLETITNVTAGEFDFGPGQAGGVIATGYKRWIIEGEMRGDVAATSDGLRLFFNNDTTAGNYYYQANRGNNTSSTATEGNIPYCGNVPANTSLADTYNVFRMVIENPDGTNIKQAMTTFNANYTTANMMIGDVGTIWNVATALSRIQIQTDNHATDQLFGTLRLYGEN